MEREPHAGSERRRGAGEIVRDMLREEQGARVAEAAAAASAADVETLRRSVRDLKHDVRMLKVGMDKQTVLLESLAGAMDDLRQERGRRR